jgi:hypothetical protein
MKRLKIFCQLAGTVQLTVVCCERCVIMTRIVIFGNVHNLLYLLCIYFISSHGARRCGLPLDQLPALEALLVRMSRDFAAAASSAAASGFNLDAMRSLLSIPPDSRRTHHILLIAREMSSLPCFQGFQGETLIVAAATAHKKLAPPDAVLAAAGETCNALSVIISGSAEIRFKKTKKDEAAKAQIDDVIEGEWRKTSLLGSVVDVLQVGDAIGEESAGILAPSRNVCQFL